MLITRMGKRLRKWMAKNAPRRGKSARNGNQPSPYTKYSKTPYKYSQKYQEWRSDRLAGRLPVVKVEKYSERYREAAE